jgi:CBS domain-containing protein
MAAESVGTLVVVDPAGRPVGILTDRDLMRHCVAEGRDPDLTKVETIMASPLVSGPEELPIEDALSRMAEAGVRRLVVVDRAGSLAGVLALDDVLELLAEEFTTIGRLVGAGR